MKRRTMFSEAAYLVGLALLAVSTALMEAADFGMSMVVAPAYVVYLKLSAQGAWSFFSFGMAVYLLQFVLLVLLAAAMRRFRISYLFSFVTAVIYGLLLDSSMALVGLMSVSGWVARGACYVVGMIGCSAGVAMLFHTYIAPEAYELVVKELSGKYGWSISWTKTVYDCVSCAVAVLMSFVFFGFGVFEGVKLGTVVCALVNGSLIGLFSRWYDQKLTFRDALPLRKYFE